MRVSMLVSASISSCASPISSKTWSRPPAEAGCLHRTPYGDVNARALSILRDARI